MTTATPANQVQTEKSIVLSGDDRSTLLDLIEKEMENCTYLNKPRFLYLEDLEKRIKRGY